MRILVLDDVEARHLVIETRFRACERTHAYTFAEAIEALAGERFDLCLLDHDLGEERTGTDVARAIAALEASRRPVEVVIHSHNPVGSERMRDILREAGILCRIEPFSGLVR